MYPRSRLRASREGKHLIEDGNWGAAKPTLRCRFRAYSFAVLLVVVGFGGILRFDPSLVLSGTVPVVGTFRFAPSFAMALPGLFPLPLGSLSAIFRASSLRLCRLYGCLGRLRLRQFRWDLQVLSALQITGKWDLYELALIQWFTLCHVSLHSIRTIEKAYTQSGKKESRMARWGALAGIRLAGIRRSHLLSR